MANIKTMGWSEIICDFENGRIYRRLKRENTYRRVGSVDKDGYIQFTFNGKDLKLHRYLYEQFHNVKLIPEEHINHINFIKYDNRISNLEIVSEQQNHQWVGKKKNNTSGYKGVHWHKDRKKWVAQIGVNRKSKFLGRFTNIEDATKAWVYEAQTLNQEGHKYFIPPTP